MTLTTQTIADLTITKTLTGSAVPGRATTYTIVVTNTGPSPVTAASVTDLFPVGSPRTGVDLHRRPRIELRRRLGHRQSRHHRHARGRRPRHVHRDRPDRGERDRPARQHRDRHGAGRRRSIPIRPNNTATSSVPLVPSADLHIAKEGPAQRRGRDQCRLHDHRHERGTIGCPGVTLADPTPPGLTFVSNAGDCTTPFPCDLGTLPRAATRTITATFAIPAGYTTPNPIANTATVSSLTPDTAADNNSATTNTPVGAPVTDLRITKTNGVNGVVAGLPTTYTITITNPLGPSDASGATVTDPFPATLTGVAWTCTGTGGGSCPSSGIGNINTPVTVPVGASVVFTAIGTVDPAATGELVNSAQVHPPLGHVNRTSAIATDRDAIGTEADVAITKMVDQGSIVPGNPLVYTITVTNTGPSNAANVVVRDPTPPGLTWVSTTGACTTPFPCTLGVVPAGGNLTITATFTVPPDYSGPSPIANVTDVSSTTVDTNTANNTATALTTVNRRYGCRGHEDRAFVQRARR